MGSGCGSVGRALTVNCIEKTKLKKWRPGMAHLKKKRENEIERVSKIL